VNALPRAVQQTIAKAIELAPEIAASMQQHYGVLMPAMREEQLRHPLMQAPLRWERLPRMRAAIERLDELDGRTRNALDASTLAELYSSTYYGAAMPLLYAYPADLAYFMSRGLSIDETIDRYLTAPIIHELCHRERDLVLHLDECIAGWLGVHVLPEFAYPAPGQDDALYASPWLAQIGAALVRVYGISSVLGGLPAALVRDAETLYWRQWRESRALHLLGNTMEPAPWLALITAGQTLTHDPAQDRRIVCDALRAMCLETTLVAGSFRTRTVLPTAPIVLEPGRVSTAPKNDLDVVAPAYWLPATVAILERRDVVLGSIEEIPALAASLVP